MKPVNRIGLIIALCLSQFFIQCSSDDKKGIEEKKITEQYTDEVIMLRDFLSKSMPVDIKKIKYDFDMVAFIVDGDMIITLENARGRYNYSNSKNISKTSQRVDSYIMHPEIAASVQVYVSPGVPSDWKIAISEAITNWNKVNSSINITTQNIKSNLTIVIDSWEGNSTQGIANAYMASSTGQPGKAIFINTYFNNLSASKKINAMVHELGHNFGLTHTNELKGTLISCTPLVDYDSVMFPITHEWTGFSVYDNIAISTLYPVAVGAKKLYRYKKNQYYFYATNACEITPGKDGYIFDGDAGYLYSTQVSGTVPLYRIVNGTTVKDHRLNKIKSSSNDVIVGYLFPTQQPGTTALYSYGIYESKLGQTPSYMYHYKYTTINSDAVLKVIVGYVSNKTITKETPKYPIVI